MIYTGELFWALIAFVAVAWFALRYLVVFKASWLTIVLVAIVGLFTLPYLPQVIVQDWIVGVVLAIAAVFAVKELLKTNDWIGSTALVLVLYVGASMVLGFRVV